MDLVVSPKDAPSTSVFHTARPNITITSSTEWKDGEKFTDVACLADSVASAAAITWHVGNGEDIISRHMETEDQANGLVSVRSSVHFLSSLFAGQNLTCMVQHPSLEVPEKRTIHIPVHSMLFLWFKYFFLCTQPHTAAHFHPPPVFSFRSPSAECVCDETAQFSFLAGSV